MGVGHAEAQNWEDNLISHVSFRNPVTSSLVSIHRKLEIVQVPGWLERRHSCMRCRHVMWYPSQGAPTATPTAQVFVFVFNAISHVRGRKVPRILNYPIRSIVWLAILANLLLYLTDELNSQACTFTFWVMFQYMSVTPPECSSVLTSFSASTPHNRCFSFAIAGHFLDFYPQ